MGAQALKSVIVVVTPVHACVDDSGFMSACFISSCLQVLISVHRQVKCAEGFAQ